MGCSLRIVGVIALAAARRLHRCQIGQTGRTGWTRRPSTRFSQLKAALRRLSQAELDNTLRDLLGEDTAPAASRLLNEDEFRPFDNDYTIQQASEALIASLEALAEAGRRTSNGRAMPPSRAALVPCTPASAGDEQCFRDLPRRVPATRASKRAVTAEDINSYIPLARICVRRQRRRR